MDPEATTQILNDADTSADDFRDALAALADWIAKGGYVPNSRLELETISRAHGFDQIDADRVTYVLDAATLAGSGIAPAPMLALRKENMAHHDAVMTHYKSDDHAAYASALRALAQNHREQAALYPDVVRFHASAEHLIACAERDEKRARDCEQTHGLCSADDESAALDEAEGACADLREVIA